MPLPFRILLADDHAAVLQRMNHLLSSEFEVIGTASTGTEMIIAAQKLKPDVIVADVSMPGLNGIEASRQVLRKIPHLPIVLLTMHREFTIVQQALEAGVRGYVHKLTAGDELIPAIRSALEGQVFISPSCTA